LHEAEQPFYILRVQAKWLITQVLGKSGILYLILLLCTYVWVYNKSKRLTVVCISSAQVETAILQYWRCYPRQFIIPKFELFERIEKNNLDLIAFLRNPILWKAFFRKWIFCRTFQASFVCLRTYICKNVPFWAKNQKNQSLFVLKYKLNL
jgi:hypothetical protein